MTTTITPAPQITLTATLLSPLHHGAGSSGNTSLLRTQEVITPEGNLARVPFVSGSSIRHGIRDVFAWHLAKRVGIEEGSLTKTAADLLWTGGAVTTTGAQTDLAMIREVDALLPPLAMLGYAARSDIMAGTLYTSDMILVCAENSARLPEGVEGDERRAAAFRSEEFGTRHDIGSTPIARLIEGATGAGSSTQMIWDMQVIRPGARMAGTLTLAPSATAEHVKSLHALLGLWAPQGQVHLGAKRAQGYGTARLDGIDAEACAEALTWWEGHIDGHRDAIMDLITRVAS